jgi:hypothetical protein
MTSFSVKQRFMFHETGSQHGALKSRDTTHVSDRLCAPAELAPATMWALQLSSVEKVSSIRLVVVILHNFKCSPSPPPVLSEHGPAKPLCTRSFCAAVADSLNVVPERILEEGSIVSAVVLCPDARCAIVPSAVLECRSMEGVHTRLVCAHSQQQVLAMPGVSTHPWP